jgi:dethiobiotin synthetase
MSAEPTGPAPGPAGSKTEPPLAAEPIGPVASGTVRPDRLVLVVGTGTGVGKTWVAAALLRGLAASGHRVAARKPAQSFGPDDAAASTDAAVLGAATGEAPETVCPLPRWYAVAMAPPMAADVLGRPPFTVADLVAEVRWPPGGSGGSTDASTDVPADTPAGGTTAGEVVGAAVGLVETAGGVRSPQAADGDAVAVGRLLGPDVVVLVADAGLGTINDVRLAADALVGVLAPVVVVLNRFDPADDLHHRNRDWLTDRDGMRVVTTPGGEDALVRCVLG